MNNANDWNMPAGVEYMDVAGVRVLASGPTYTQPKYGWNNNILRQDTIPIPALITGYVQRISDPGQPLRWVGSHAYDWFAHTLDDGSVIAAPMSRAPLMSAVENGVIAGGRVYGAFGWKRLGVSVGWVPIVPDRVMFMLWIKALYFAGGGSSFDLDEARAIVDALIEGGHEMADVARAILRTIELREGLPTLLTE
jgi:hypothetical protein